VQSAKTRKASGRAATLALAAAAFLLPAAVKAQAPAKQTGPLTQTECEPLLGYTHDRVTCGYLSVEETPGGRDLSLAVAVVRARDGKGTDEPVVFIHGGPGGQAIGGAAYYARHPINRTRDVVLFDQRMSGRSLPEECTEDAARFLDIIAADLSAKQAVAATAELELSCRDRMVNANADLNGYGTRATVGDLEVLRQALGIRSWNVFGVSYGTTVALDYARSYPDSIRALVLDSVYPPSFAPGGDAATRSFARALEQLYEDCRQDDACRDAFPGLETSFLATLIALEREPLAVPARDRTLIPSGTFFLNAQDLTSIVHQMMYQRDTISLVPKVIDLAARQNGAALSGMIDVLAPLALRIDMAARNAVECRERWLMPGRDLQDMNRLERFLRGSLTIFDTEDILCAEWAPTFEDASFNEPVSSPLPAIFYAGANDPITPPSNTLASFRRFPAGQYVHVRHTGHGVDRSHDCVRELTASFLDGPETLIRDGCVSTIAPIPFVTDVALSRGVLAFATGVLQLQSPFLLVSLAIGGLMIVVGLLWTLTALGRGHPGRRPSTLALGSAALSGAAGLTLLVFAAVLTLTIADVGAGLMPAMLALGLPAQEAWLLVLPPAAAIAAATGTVLLVLAIARGGANTRAHNPLLALVVGCGLVLAVLWWQGFFAPVGGSWGSPA